MNLLIDTNVFLSFYHYSSDDLEELNKLVVLLRQGEVKLYLPEQIDIEFWRNRAGKIADAMKKLREQHLNIQFPQLSKDYNEYTYMREAQREYSLQHAQLINRIKKDIAEQKLKADTIIMELFDLAESISTSEDIVKRARFRMDIGNPPGKKGSFGDSIIWETLLEKVPNGEDLYFITDDRDYSSPLNPASFTPYLLEEWKDKKLSNLISYKRLSDFFADNNPDIELASEIDKDLLISALASSTYFANTHGVIARLSKYPEFTQTQLNEIVSAAVSNTQIYWIIEDDDINDFFMNIIREQEQIIEPENLNKLKDLLSEATIEDEIPF